VVWVDPFLEALPAKIAARDQLDRASTSIVLNLAEGNGKRSRIDRCRYLDIARGSALECAACLDVLAAKNLLEAGDVTPGKEILLGIVSMIAGLIARFTGEAHEKPAFYGSQADGENEND
jgi:four helix bundle protein